MSPSVETPGEIAPPLARGTVGPGHRIMALTGVGVVLWLAAWYLVVRPAVYVGGAVLLLVLVTAGLPFGLGWFLGRKAGGPQWWEAAVAGVLATWLHGMLAASLSGALLVAMTPDAGLAALPGVLLGMVARSNANFGVIELAALGGGAFLGARGRELPAPLATSRRWRRAGVAAVFLPFLIAILTTLPSTVRGATDLWRATRAAAGESASRGSSASPEGAGAPTVAPRGEPRPAPAPTHADSTAHVLASLLDVMEAQAMHRAVHDAGYAATPEELDFPGGGMDLWISWASDDGWSGVLRDTRRPSLWCAVVVGEVPPQRWPAEAVGQTAGRPYCGT